MKKTFIFFTKIITIIFAMITLKSIFDLFFITPFEPISPSKLLEPNPYIRFLYNTIPILKIIFYGFMTFLFTELLIYIRKYKKGE